MGGANSSSAGRRYRRARRLKGSKRGVVAVIGTLLALLVFFALFGIFLTEYVPLWMVDNESQFTAQAAASFAQLKSNLDFQYTIGGPISFGTPFTLTSGSVPLIAAPTQGTLVFLPANCAPQSVTVGANTYSVPFYTATAHDSGANWMVGQPVSSAHCNFVNVTIGYGPGGTGHPYYQEVETGTLQMTLPNRYYTAETFFFEDDGVVQSQSGGYQIMAFPPPLNVTTYAGNTTVTTSFLQLYGNSTSVVGQQSQEVYTTLRYSQETTSNGEYVASTKTYTPTNFTFEIGTQYPCAWYSFLNGVMLQSGLPAADFTLTYAGSTTPPTFSACSTLNGHTAIVQLEIGTSTAGYVNYVTLFYAGAQVTLGVQG